jgi:hypothetical protein
VELTALSINRINAAADALGALGQVSRWTDPQTGDLIAIALDREGLAEVQRIQVARLLGAPPSNAVSAEYIYDMVAGERMATKDPFDVEDAQRQLQNAEAANSAVIEATRPALLKRFGSEMAGVQPAVGWFDVKDESVPRVGTIQESSGRWRHASKEPNIEAQWAEADRQRTEAINRVERARAHLATALTLTRGRRPRGDKAMAKTPIEKQAERLRDILEGLPNHTNQARVPSGGRL